MHANRLKWVNNWLNTQKILSLQLFCCRDIGENTIWYWMGDMLLVLIFCQLRHQHLYGVWKMCWFERFDKYFVHQHLPGVWEIFDKYYVHQHLSGVWTLTRTTQASLWRRINSETVTTNYSISTNNKEDNNNKEYDN